ncbi:hypothetical protein [Actinoplanes sp. GCM10030250]|uniref:hypothetical protein n=1 Tax=Actinoplanes sp. GCM10030250 TaxID=3273376 RepID=UPI003611E034
MRALLRLHHAIVTPAKATSNWSPAWCPSRSACSTTTGRLPRPAAPGDALQLRLSVAFFVVAAVWDLDAIAADGRYDFGYYFGADARSRRMADRSHQI